MQVFNAAKQDSVRVNVLNQLSKQLLSSNADKSFAYAQQSQELAIKIKYKPGLAYAYKYLGIGYFNTGSYLEALKNYELSLETFKAIDDKRGIANMYMNVGNVYYNKGGMMTKRWNYIFNR